MPDRIRQRAAALALTPLGAPSIPPTVRQPSLLHVLGPKLLTARTRSAERARGRLARVAVLLLVGLLFWGFVFRVLIRVLTYFHDVPEIGALLA
ncbi:MAG TPA: hypothetical protein VFJ96_01165, partial [Gemmatimonadaceae bacterium]|nr:hypothetical protein [Gemmatimonadaceae bacterium]